MFPSFFIESIRRPALSDCLPRHMSAASLMPALVMNNDSHDTDESGPELELTSEALAEMIRSSQPDGQGAADDIQCHIQRHLADVHLGTEVRKAVVALRLRLGCEQQDEVRRSVAREFIEGVDLCTSGWLIRLQALLVEGELPATFDQLLQRFHYHLITRAHARYMYNSLQSGHSHSVIDQSVHLLNDFLRRANTMGLPVPVISHDPYSSGVCEKEIDQCIIQTYRQDFTLRYMAENLFSESFQCIENSKGHQPGTIYTHGTYSALADYVRQRLSLKAEGFYHLLFQTNTKFEIVDLQWSYVYARVVLHLDAKGYIRPDKQFQSGKLSCKQFGLDQNVVWLLGNGSEYGLSYCLPDQFLLDHENDLRALERQLDSSMQALFDFQLWPRSGSLAHKASLFARLSSEMQKACLEPFLLIFKGEEVSSQCEHLQRMLPQLQSAFIVVALLEALPEEARWSMLQTLVEYQSARHCQRRTSARRGRLNLAAVLALLPASCRFDALLLCVSSRNFDVFFDARRKCVLNAFTTTFKLEPTAYRFREYLKQPRMIDCFSYSIDSVTPFLECIDDIDDKYAVFNALFSCTAALTAIRDCVEEKSFAEQWVRVLNELPQPLLTKVLKNEGSSSHRFLSCFIHALRDADHACRAAVLPTLKSLDCQKWRLLLRQFKCEFKRIFSRDHEIVLGILPSLVGAGEYHFVGKYFERRFDRVYQAAEWGCLDYRDYLFELISLASGSLEAANIALPLILKQPFSLLDHPSVALQVWERILTRLRPQHVRYILHQVSCESVELMQLSLPDFQSLLKAVLGKPQAAIKVPILFYYFRQTDITQEDCSTVLKSIYDAVDPLYHGLIHDGIACWLDHDEKQQFTQLRLIQCAESFVAQHLFSWLEQYYGSVITASETDVDELTAITQFRASLVACIKNDDSFAAIGECLGVFNRMMCVVHKGDSLQFDQHFYHQVLASRFCSCFNNL